MAEPEPVPGAANDAEFRGSVPHAMSLMDSLARIARKRPHSNAPRLSATSGMSA